MEFTGKNWYLRTQQILYSKKYTSEAFMYLDQFHIVHHIKCVKLKIASDKFIEPEAETEYIWVIWSKR